MAQRPPAAPPPERHLAPLTERLDLLLRQKPRITVALEGSSASGKSTAARRLAARYDCRVVTMDDFFLPPALRTPSRFAEPGGNIHYERFARQVLPCLLSGEALDYPSFDCGTMDYGPRRRLPPARLTVVEGVYCRHPLFGQPYDLTVFLPVDPDLQRQRILARNGPALLRRYTEEWIPLENLYFSTFRIRETSDLVL